MPQSSRATPGRVGAPQARAAEGWAPEAVGPEDEAEDEHVAGSRADGLWAAPPGPRGHPVPDLGGDKRRPQDGGSAGPSTAAPPTEQPICPGM